MGKARGKVKRTKVYRHNVDRKRMWKKSKQMPTIKCTEIKAAWKKGKSIDANMSAMGLTLHLDDAFKIDDTKDSLRPDRKTPKDPSRDVEMSEAKVADLLEYEASKPKESTMRLSEPEAQFCMTMLEKYGDDYKAMARDANNYYQETPKQIRRKILTFRRFPGSHADFLKGRNLPPMDTD
ncbi:hypothetical protein RvY_04883 [Ramazzottius varieornatus]|uniref:Nucleolar protein 16 n=1 Tax=Ramazzottius varieornatus TaxID=947166 RepID=A0A1D1UZR8_RAMVA|nr:hypothetical protein RvY_04883 [Ramazzottius varieornatus]